MCTIGIRGGQQALKHAHHLGMGPVAGPNDLFDQAPLLIHHKTLGHATRLIEAFNAAGWIEQRWERQPVPLHKGPDDLGP